MRRLRQIISACLLLSLLTTAGCVYYNTFYNAKKAFNQSEEARHQAEARSSGGKLAFNTSGYNKAIEKALKVIEYYPDSKYYDDALHVLMVSYFYTDEFTKSERRAREMLANYPESEFADEATLYLAKSKLLQDEIQEAMEIFQEIFEEDYKPRFKAEAALALGRFHYDNRNWETSRSFLVALRDSLGRPHEQRLAQRMIAESYFTNFRFAEAKSAALQLLGMEPDRRDKYFALDMAAQCSYRLQQFQEGHDYVERLQGEDVYFDSVGVLDLLKASGYEDAEELGMAQSIYEKVLTEQTQPRLRSRAFWRLGLMYQFDYDSLTKAKHFYDSTASLARTTDYGQEALQRSADIGKLDQYARSLEIDSTTSQVAIDEAAYTQYQLSELYWFKLNKPDTGIMEMRYVVDSFPSAYDAPKAMIALSQMIESHRGDSAAADSILLAMLERYPHSDYVPEALKLLDLDSTEADTGYAGLYVHRAEKYIVDTLVVDSARHYYQYVVDNFPDSKYHLQARFALIWLTEQYDHPGDSSVIYAYNELIDSFPGSYWATLASDRTAHRASTPRRDEQPAPFETTYVEGDSIIVDTLAGIDPETGDTLDYTDPLTQAYIGPNGEHLENMAPGLEPIRVEEPFEYPTEAYRSKWEGHLYFQILLDFSGEVTDYKLVVPSPNEEINRRAEEAVASTAWDITRIPGRLQGQWLVYKFSVFLPSNLR